MLYMQRVHLYILHPKHMMVECKMGSTVITKASTRDSRLEHFACAQVYKYARLKGNFLNFVLNSWLKEFNTAKANIDSPYSIFFMRASKWMLVSSEDLN